MFTVGRYAVKFDKKLVTILKKQKCISLHPITSGVTHTGATFKRSLLVTDEAVLIYIDTELDCDSASVVYHSQDQSLKTQIPAGQPIISSKLVLANPSDYGAYFRLYLQVPKQKYSAFDKKNSEFCEFLD